MFITVQYFVKSIWIEQGFWTIDSAGILRIENNKQL